MSSFASPTAELPPPTLTSRFVSGLLNIQPLYQFAKQRARRMMIQRAEGIGVYWHKEAQALRSRNQPTDFAPEWEADLAQLRNDDLAYPDYYLKPFHAYAEGNLGWDPAMEAEVAAKAVHARIWPEEDAQGDIRLRKSYHDVVKANLAEAPATIVDLGCSVGLSTFSLQQTFPEAQITGIDLSPYFVAIAQYRGQQRHATIQWKHAAAENTGLPAAAYDLVSACLVFHELPRTAAREILREGRRLLKPGGHFTLMDMNPASPIYASMPPYILTLLKSTEPYLDDYFSFDLFQAFEDAGFERPSLTSNTPRHRTLIAKAI